jgi:hypothetical protein
MMISSEDQRMSNEISYAPRTDEKRELWSMKISPRVRYLAGVAARASGKTLSAYTENELNCSFERVKIEDDMDDEPGRTLQQLADELYQPTEAGRFLALVKIAPWLISDAESRLLRILQHSDYFAPLYRGHRTLNEGRVQEHWTVLSAIRDREVDIDILPPEHRPNPQLQFGLLGDAERVALYKADKAKFDQVSKAYQKAMKGSK